MSVEVTRNYGETAAEKASELILHLAIATLSVTALIWLVLGWREALVVLVAVPVTLALTLFVYYALGYTLNRITLFALIFSIGILVDDAIVVVENIYRHLADGPTRTPRRRRSRRVDEVGNPTILATFTVIAAILPMAFVSGLMGPYMRPIPVGASVAMLASLAVAFIVTPYLGYRLLKGHVVHADAAAAAAAGGKPDFDARFGASYGRLMRRLMDNGGRRRLFYVGVVALLLLSVGLLGLRLVQVKMLPFDNKSEFQVILDMPEGTLARDVARRWRRRSAAYLRTVPEVQSTQVYAGTAAPFNFNGLVRHYFMRRGANVADVQVNLVPKHDRRGRATTSPSRCGRRWTPSRGSTGRAAKVAEIPPGPPVLSTLVAEIYAANDSARLEAATKVREVFERTEGVVDVDWTVEAPQQKLRFHIDRVRAAQAGASVEQLAQTVYLAQSGVAAGLAQGARTAGPGDDRAAAAARVALLAGGAADAAGGHDARGRSRSRAS